ncbi:MAG: [FeFe] hydrogenase H-cluster maturation GTPase HydF [Alphaproteobacteria bacterium]|nr:[FeFe] hydrogenase H-cluster maturation GTPase HydF [Alphaproteobacteria bacterium]
MGLNDTPSSERLHIGIFGSRNAGKSSLINALTHQNLAVVSDVAGTTTDPVYKSMEILPLGPVVLIDTAGIDDEGDLGALRVQKTKQVLNKTDVALVVIDSSKGIQKFDQEIIDLIIQKSIPYLIVMNKADLKRTENDLCISCKTGQGIEELKQALIRLVPKENQDKKIVGDLISAGDVVILVTPIDESAPKGRLILPQQQTIRDILEAKACSMVVQETELKTALSKLAMPPKMVITDSQVFKKVAADLPDEIPLTSFSILMARYKGNLKQQADGAKYLRQLKDGDTVLISEGCTHHRQCNDIGSVKIPGWIKDFTKKELSFEFTSGTEFPLDLSKYAMIVHCGGCMLNEREMKYRLKCADDAKIPMTNYGMLIAYIHGIFDREFILKNI